MKAHSIFWRFIPDVACLSLAMKKKGFSVLPPIELKQGFDMCERPLFLALLGLVRIGRIRFIWVAPPCTTFSLARTPKLRSLKVPWGFDLLHPKVVGWESSCGSSFVVVPCSIFGGRVFRGGTACLGFHESTSVVETFGVVRE